MKLLKNPQIRNILLIVGIITGFIFIVAFTSLYVSDAIKHNNACGCVIPIPIMILILSSLGIFVGSIASYLFILVYGKEQKSIDESLSFTLNFLNPDQRKIIKSLIGNKGTIKQHELEKATGFNKVKIHRTVNKLKEKGVISIENNGKVNIIHLNNEYHILFDH